MKVKRSMVSLLLIVIMLFGCIPAFVTAAATENSEQTNVLPVETVKDWRLVGTEDYVAFELVFSDNVMPFGPGGEEYRMMDGDSSQTAYASMFKFCGSTVADINANATDTSMSGWTFEDFPSNMGGVYKKPILIYVHQLFQIQFRVNVSYLEDIDGDITFEIVENSVITDKNGNSYTAGEGLLWTLTDDVKASGLGNWYTDKPVDPADRNETVGVSSITQFRKDTSMSEYYVTDILFSRDVFKTNDLGIIGYSVQDGSSGDFSSFKNYFTINGKTVAQINAETDDSEYNYVTFKGGASSLLVPVMLVSIYKNQMTVALHEKYVEDNNVLSSLTLGVTDAFSSTVKAPNAEETKYEKVEYTVSGAYSFTLNSDMTFSTENTLLPYVADTEIIERKYTAAELDEMEWNKINLHSISTIVSIGDVRWYNGEKRTQAQYVVLYFDSPLCYQYIPYASGGKINLITLANSTGSEVNLTEKQIDAYYDYHMDLYLKKYIKIDGRTIEEIQDDETDPTASPDVAVRVHYAGSSSLPSSLVIYFEYNSNAWMNSETEHSIEILSGFRTPLFGEVKADKKFVYEPKSKEWASVSAGSVFANDTLVDTASAGGGCSGAVNGTVIICTVTLVTALAFIKIKKGEYER